MELRMYIFKNRIKQAPFAKKIGCSVIHLGRIVNGLAPPSAMLAVKIVAATNGEVSFEDLFADKLEMMKKEIDAKESAGIC